MEDSAAHKRKEMGAIVGTVLAYVAALVFAFIFVEIFGFLPPVVAAAGIAFAAVYVWGWKVVPALFVVPLFALSVLAFLNGDFTVTRFAEASLLMFAPTTHSVLGVILIARVAGHRLMFTSTREIASFLVLGGIVATMPSAAIATLTRVAFGSEAFDNALSLWMSFWSASAIGVVVFAPITLMLIPSQKPVWSKRRLKVALPSLVAVGLFLALMVQLGTAAATARDLRVDQLATAAGNTVEREVARVEEKVEGLSSFFESSDVVDSDEFQTYARETLKRFPSLEALSYHPLISRDELEEFETNQRDVQGLDNYRVTERNDEGDLVPVGVRDEYVPVGYIAPSEDFPVALGFDINSDPAAKPAIDRARIEGVPTATGPIGLLEGSGEQTGTLVIPIFDRQGLAVDAPSSDGPLTGFAVGVYRLNDLLSDAFVGPAWDQVDVRLTDVTDGEDGVQLAFRGSPKPEMIEESRLLGTEAKGPTLDVYGRQWQVEIIPTSRELQRAGLPFPLTLKLFAVAGMTLLQAFLLLVTGLEREARRRATEASREAATDPLTGLQNRRAFLRSLAAVRERSTAEDSSDVLMSLDLDKFKRVNDEGGHQAGDELLQKVAAVFSANLRSRDVIARLGGDEFAIILNNCLLPRALDIAQKLVTEVGAASVTGPHGPLSVGLSVGITTIEPNEGADIDELLRRTDTACYEAKRSGGGVAVFDRQLSSIE